jgi:hypothetical protein
MRNRGEPCNLRGAWGGIKWLVKSKLILNKGMSFYCLWGRQGHVFNEEWSRTIER